VTPDGWISIPNWDKFQHGHKRTHPWIRLYLELNSKDEWLSLTTAERGLLVTIWMEYARSNRALRVQKVRSLCASCARDKHFESLNQAGFIQLCDSKPSRARAREEVSKDTSKNARHPANAKQRMPREEEEFRDPEALAKIRELAEQIGRRM